MVHVPTAHSNVIVVSYQFYKRLCIVFFNLRSKIDGADI